MTERGKEKKPSKLVSFWKWHSFCKALSKEEKNIKSHATKKIYQTMQDESDNFLPSNLTLPFQKS